MLNIVSSLSPRPNGLAGRARPNGLAGRALESGSGEVMQEAIKFLFILNNLKPLESAYPDFSGGWGEVIQQA